MYIYIYVYTLSNFQRNQNMSRCPETARISEGHSIKSCSWFSIKNVSYRHAEKESD